MKTLALAFLAFFIFTIHSFGQITITQADMPGLNDTIRFSNALTSGNLAYQQAGTNQVWNFSELSPTTQDLDSYKASLLTPYAFFFFGLNKYGKKVADTLGVAAFQFTDIYTFYKKSAPAFEAEGIGLKYLGLPLPAYYSDKDEIYQFPLYFGRRDSSTFKFSISISTLISYSQVGYRINEVEGWGSITTPYGTFDCIKVKSTISSNDSLNLSGVPLKFNRKMIEYKWLANGQKIPILEISGNLFGGNFVPTAVKYRDIKRDNVLFQPPVAQFSATPTQVELFQSAIFNNNSQGNFLQYLWTFNPSSGINFENGTTDTSKNPVVSFSETGIYSVTLRASNFLGQNEKVRTEYITVFDPLAMTKPEKELEVFVFQNFSEPFYFLAPKSIKVQKAELIDFSGKIHSVFFSGNTIRAGDEAGFLPKGVYLIRLVNSEKQWSQKLVSR